jgi:hypothetical protein
MVYTLPRNKSVVFYMNCANYVIVCSKLWFSNLITRKSPWYTLNKRQGQSLPMEKRTPSLQPGVFNFPLSQCYHMSLMDFIVSPPGCGWSVTDIWGWDAHEAQLHCPNEVDGDIWIWSTRRALNLSSIKLPRPWSPWESSPSRKTPHGRTRNRTRDLVISSQKLWPLDHKPQPGVEPYFLGHTHLADGIKYITGHDHFIACPS